MSLSLSSKVVGDGPAVILLHGLFGMGNNLKALARFLSEKYRVYSVDLPNHGRSDWMAATDIPALASSVRDWMKQEKIEHACFVGHSLGGKVAMRIALDYPSAVDALVVADIAPVAYPPQHESVFAALDAVVNGQCGSRDEAAQLMRRHLTEDVVVQFLLMNLMRCEDGVYRWRFNLEGIRASYDDLRAALLPGKTYGGAVLFVGGGGSNYIQPAHERVILSFFPAASAKVIPDCGHWLHIQQPRSFNGIVGRFLERGGHNGRPGHGVTG